MHHSRLATIVIDCQTGDIDTAARFWAEALGSAAHSLPDPSEAAYRRIAMEDSQPTVLVQAVSHSSRVHLDIETDDIDAEVARLEQLGARRIAQVKHW